MSAKAAWVCVVPPRLFPVIFAYHRLLHIGSASLLDLFSPATRRFTMDVDGSGSGGTSVDTEPTGTQVATLRQQMGATHNQQEMADSSKMLLMLLKQFVSAVSSDASIDTEVHPEAK
jgi:hypothetical protein